MIPLPRSFYLRPTLQVAKDLLGKVFVRRSGGKLLSGKIVEVEAYRSKDPASHSFRGKTKRNEVMFGPGGHLYVYFTYGMHFCANVVTGKEGIGEAVLIRAVEPIAGIEVMSKNRTKKLSSGVVEPLRKKSIKMEGSYTPNFLHNLTNGPAKFCQAFGIIRKDNGANLSGDQIFIYDPMSKNKYQITNPKFEIRNAKSQISAQDAHAPSVQNPNPEIFNSIIANQKSAIANLTISSSPRIGIRSGLEKKWRFYIKGNPWVSR